MSLKTKITSQAESTDLIYYDVVVSNLNTQTIAPQDLFYQEVRSVPFLTNPEQYRMSIIRFTLDTGGTLPVVLPLIQSNQSDINLTIYSVTLSYNGIDSQAFIEFVPEDLSAAIPTPPSSNLTGLQNNQTGYYNIYSYQHWISMINKAFETAFTNLQTLVGVGFPTTVSPKIVWDINTNTAVLYSPYLYYNSWVGTNQISIFMNAPLFEMFNSFPNIIQNYATVTNGKNFQIQTTFLTNPPVQNFPTNNPNAVLCIITQQELSTVANMSPILSVVFTSDTMPIIAEQVSKPLIIANGKTLQAYGNNAAIANVITDLVTEDGIYTPNLVYSPSAQYRYIQLNTNTPLTRFDFRVFYKLRTGELIPFKLVAGASASIKILFQKKNGYI